MRGGTLGGGEREAQTIFDYGVAGRPCSRPTRDYVALGHLHRTQELPAPCPVVVLRLADRRSTSARSDDTKHVLVSTPRRERRPGARRSPLTLAVASCARVTRHRRASSRQSRRRSATRWLRVVVSEPARAGLADEVRALLPSAVDVRIERVADDGDRERRPTRRAGRTAARAVRRVPRRADIDDPARRSRCSPSSSTRTTGRPDAPGPAATCEGFGAFRDADDVVDFDDIDLFALVGPTGSGKSTVIDAICFALYGSVPRYGDEGGRRGRVGRRQQEAKVELTFESARRALRRGPGRAPGATARRGHAKEARLEQLQARRPTSRWPSAAQRDGRRPSRGCSGSPFDHFTQCVVLPQGEFARFLHDKPADRQDLLVQLLGSRLRRRWTAGEPQRRPGAGGRSTSPNAPWPTSPSRPTPTRVAIEARREALGRVVVREVDAARRARARPRAGESRRRRRRRRARHALVDALEAVAVPRRSPSWRARPTAAPTSWPRADDWRPRQRAWTTLGADRQRSDRDALAAARAAGT